MRYVFLALAVGVSLHGQAMTDAAAAAAGGIVGGAAGKKVSDGLTSVLGNVAKQTQQAAASAKPKAVVAAPAPVPGPAATPLIEVSPGVPTSGGVPLPPPAPHKGSYVPPPPPPPVVAPEPPPPPPPAPEATAADLKNIVAGTHRDDVLKLGDPGSRLMMFDDGHLQEIYRYYSRGPNGFTPIGVVRLVDGAVSAVEVR